MQNLSPPAPRIGSLNGSPRVSVIIPTTCEDRRTLMIRRAITSVQSQDGEIELLVVVNGSSYAESLLSELRANNGLKVVQIEEGNVSAARYAGLLAVTGDLFCFLDDDDELLPGALSTRVGCMASDVDVLVTNGYRHNGGDGLVVQPELAERINADLVGTFLEYNWFASASALFRRGNVDVSLFDFRIKYFEWTFLFFKLIEHPLTIRFVDQVTYRIHEDHPVSASKSIDYTNAHPGFLQELMSMKTVVKGRNFRELRRKYQAALNRLSRIESERGDRAAAWAAHARCLMAGGWRYLPYTRHLISFTTFTLPRPRS